MSVLIKGMEMPKNCKECPFSDHEAWCLIPGNWRERYSCPDDCISENCPLVALPDKHGRLVDADELIIDLMDRGLEMIQTDDWAEIQQTVMDAPTIVEAEDGICK